MINETVYVVAFAGDTAVPNDRHVCFFGHLDRAAAYRDKLGGDARVYRMEPLSESGHWDWAVDHHRGYGPMEYVNERAARNCVGAEGTLLRRCSGTDEWATVTP